MDGYKDFQGKTLDDAIREATAYFDVAREKLEIDIVQDAKSGVFGLIGARKAKVRARRVQLKNTVDELVGRGRDLRASFRDEFDSTGSTNSASDTDMLHADAPRYEQREAQFDEQDARQDVRQATGRERSSRRGRQDRQSRERADVGQFDDSVAPYSEQGTQDERCFANDERRSASDERHSNNDERRSGNNRRQRNDRSSERSDRNQDRSTDRSERNNGERTERNQDRSRRSRSDRNQERPTQERLSHDRQENSASRHDFPQSEGNFEPMDDENAMLTDAESRERSSRRRRRGRGRSRSRTDGNGAENGLDMGYENGDSQDMLTNGDADMAPEMVTDFDAPRYADSHAENRSNQENRRPSRRDNDNRRSGDSRRSSDNRRSADSRRDSENRRQGDSRRSSYDRNERPYRSPERRTADSQAHSFNENEEIQDTQLLDDQVYDRPEGLPDIPLESLDQELVYSVALEVTERLVFPIIGTADLTVEATDGRVKVGIDCGENSGLLIGREGQTLASIQYLASRIIARKLGAAVRVQLDTGDYRERQDEKLRELALSFAERVRATGRPQSTRPLSSYHRRVVHLVLQDDEEIVTRSKGEGPLKRVIILRRRKNSAD